jgi:hypothetical protein
MSIAVRTKGSHVYKSPTNRGASLTHIEKIMAAFEAGEEYALAVKVGDIFLGVAPESQARFTTPEERKAFVDGALPLMPAFIDAKDDRVILAIGPRASDLPEELLRAIKRPGH